MHGLADLGLPRRRRARRAASAAAAGAVVLATLVGRFEGPLGRQAQTSGAALLGSVRGPGARGPARGGACRLWALSERAAACAALGLAPGASKEEIKARYRRLAATEHPDLRPGDEAAAARFVAITAAYQQLTAPPPPPPPLPSSSPSGVAPMPEHSRDAWRVLLGPLGISVADFRSALGVMVDASLVVGVLFVLGLGLLIAFDVPDRLIFSIFPDPPWNPEVFQAPGGEDAAWDAIEEAAGLQEGREYLQRLGMQPDPELSRAAVPGIPLAP